PGSPFVGDAAPGRFRHPDAMTTGPRRSRGRLAGLVAIIGVLTASIVPATAAAADFPPSDAGYHSYAEMVAEIHDVEAAHPELVDVFSIGRSAKGRDIWAAKVSDHVEMDED